MAFKKWGGVHPIYFLQKNVDKRIILYYICTKQKGCKMILYNKVREIIIKELNKDPQKVRDTFALVSDLGADSLNVWQIMTSIEKEFGIELESSAIKHDTTVSELIKKVRTKVNIKNGKEPVEPNANINPQVADKVMEIFKLVIGGDIKPTSTVYDELEADSLDVEDIAYKIEEAYFMDVKDDFFRNPDLTVQDVIIFVDRLVKRENRKKQIEILANQKAK